MTPFKDYSKRTVTFVVIPHDRARPWRVNVRLWALHVLGAAVLAFAAWAFLAVSSSVDEQLTLAAHQKMKREMKEVSEELEASRAVIARMEQLDKDLRKVLNLKNQRRAGAYRGKGGPRVSEEANFAKVLQDRREAVSADLVQELKDVKQEALTQEASFKEIQVFLDQQHSVLAATPSIWPVNGWITSGFGSRASPLTGEAGRHMGVDIANETNTPIRAAADGLVTYAGWEGSYGRVIAIEHGYGYSTRYGHCARLKVKVGDEVKRGQVIAYIGSTGRSTGSHCHYEVRRHGVPVDPTKYLPAQQ
jgi:murein DD-endopeptidase MepM/ murein hydrolase activator NlpD